MLYAYVNNFTSLYNAGKMDKTLYFTASDLGVSLMENKQLEGDMEKNNYYSLSKVKEQYDKDKKINRLNKKG